MVERNVAPNVNGARKFDLDCLPYIFTIEELTVLEKFRFLKRKDSDQPDKIYGRVKKRIR